MTAGRPIRWASLVIATKLAAAALDRTGTNAPNIIWFITDDQDAVLGSYNIMPNLQRYMIDGGMQFTNAFVASPKCCPSRTSALSGRFPHRLNDQQLGWCGNFSSDQIENNTFVASLQSAGYCTGFVGKYYNGEANFCGEKVHVPRGYDGPSGYWFSMCTEVRYYGLPYNYNGQMLQSGYEPTDYLTAVLGNRTLEFLAQATARPGQPFYGYVAHHAPHLPAIPAPWYANATVPAQAPRTPNWNTGMAGKHYQVASNGPMPDYFQAASDAVHGDRLRSLMSVDDALGAMFEALEAAGVLNNTYVIYTSDHGYHLGQFGLWAEKSQPYETDANIPFFVRGPGVQPNTTNEALVSAIDVGATILELAGVTAAGQRTTDGRSIVPLLQGQGVVDAEHGQHESAWSGEDEHGQSESTVTTATASWPRDRVLIEFFGYPTQYLSPCSAPTVGNNSIPQTTCPQPAGVPTPLIDDVTNTYAALRILNSSMNVLYAEYRPPGTDPAHASTNWTEAYDLLTDPWQLTNLADPAYNGSDKLPPAVLAQLSAELWAVANCALDECP